MLAVHCNASALSLHCLRRTPTSATFPQPLSSSAASTRRALLVSSIATPSFSTLNLILSAPSKSAIITDFFDLPDSGGVKALDLRAGTGPTPVDGDQVAIHYYGRLAAKQGWRFDSTYDHKDSTGEPMPFIFILGSGKINIPSLVPYPSTATKHRILGRRRRKEAFSDIDSDRALNCEFAKPLTLEKVIAGIESALRSMKVGGTRRVIIPPSQGYQNTSQEPIPPNFFDRQRLFTTIFNPTRLANGEGSTLGTLIFDIELLSVRH